ncbi:MAG: hypothetical protein V2A73_16955 [Pseudomonadota bacterium]
MKALVIREPNKETQVRGQQLGLKVVVADGWSLHAPKTLFASPKATIPWYLLEAGFGFLDRWDVAAPLWRYGVLASDVGGPSEQARTKKICRDLRLLLYAHELLFVKDNEAGNDFLVTWLRELEGGAEPRLAFLRALHIVKPIFCALPRSWLQEVAGVASQREVISMPPQRPVPAAAVQGRRPPRPKGNLIQVELAPGRYVCCKPEEAEMYRERFAQMRRKRGK